MRDRNAFLAGKVRDRTRHPPHPLMSPCGHAETIRGLLEQFPGFGWQRTRLLQDLSFQSRVTVTASLLLPLPCDANPLQNIGARFGIVRTGTQRFARQPLHRNLQIDAIQEGP